MSGVPRPERLFALLQLSDSAFPSGGFNNSSGLEQLVRDGLVTGPDALASFCASVLHASIATADAPASFLAARAAAAGDLATVVSVDRRLHRLKAAAELRAASLSTGRRVAQEVGATVEDDILARYVALLAKDRQLGMHPVAFAVACSALGVEACDVPPALMLVAMSAVAQASMRLLPVSHRDVQGILHELRPQIAALAVDIARVPEPLTDFAATDAAVQAFRSFHPLQEIASMRHALAEARLFAS